MGLLTPYLTVPFIIHKNRNQVLDPDQSYLLKSGTLIDSDYSKKDTKYFNDRRNNTFIKKSCLNACFFFYF